MNAMSMVIFKSSNIVSTPEKKYLNEQVPPHDVCYKRFPKKQVQNQLFSSSQINFRIVHSELQMH